MIPTNPINKIQNILVMFGDYYQDFEKFCKEVFSDEPRIVRRLDFSGPYGTYIPAITITLSRYGRLTSGENALVRLLREVRERWGSNYKDYLTALITEWEEYLREHPDYGKEEPVLGDKETIPGSRQHIRMKDATGNIFPLGNDNINQINLNPTIRLDSTLITPKQPAPSYLFVDQLRKVPYFKGREAELEIILHALWPGCMLTLQGTGGIGKTALASKAIDRLEETQELGQRFPDGVIVCEFYNQPAVEKAFERIVRFFDPQANKTDTEAVRGHLLTHTALLVLDGAEDADDLPALLRVRGKSGVLITSRKKSDAGANLLTIETLPEEHAVELLRAWDGDRAGDDEAARQICHCVGRLPLAIPLIGRYLRQTGETAAEYLEWLRPDPTKASLPNAKHRDESVDRLLTRSVAQISEEARQMLRIISLLAYAPFRRETLENVLNMVSEPGFLSRIKDRLLRKNHPQALDVRAALGELVNYGLLTRPDELYKISHVLIYSYVKTHFPVDIDVVDRLAGYYTAICQAIEEDERKVEGYHYLNLEQAHIMAVLTHCIKKEAWETSLTLLWSLEGYFGAQGYWTDFRSAAEFGLTAARELENQKQEAHCILALGDVHLRLDEYEQARARYEAARPIYAQIGDRLGEAHCMKALGEVHRMLSEYEQARARYEAARPIYAQIGARLGEANCMKALGDVHRMLSEYEQARARYEAARPIYAQIGARLGEA
ncbi:MAG: tetratricopeptide repeat protein, partial [Gammaproteobacteria bacterium]|nr:tetratricopeptide repeat protein [Gammaproteobacteria bacterium]